MLGLNSGEILQFLHSGGIWQFYHFISLDFPQFNINFSQLLDLNLVTLFFLFLLNPNPQSNAFKLQGAEARREIG